MKVDYSKIRLKFFAASMFALICVIGLIRNVWMAFH